MSTAEINNKPLMCPVK